MEHQKPVHVWGPGYVGSHAILAPAHLWPVRLVVERRAHEPRILFVVVVVIIIVTIIIIIIIIIMIIMMIYWRFHEPGILNMCRTV